MSSQTMDKLSEKDEILLVAMRGYQVIGCLLVDIAAHTLHAEKVSKLLL